MLIWVGECAPDRMVQEADSNGRLTRITDCLELDCLARGGRLVWVVTMLQLNNITTIKNII